MSRGNKGRGMGRTKREGECLGNRVEMCDGM